MQYLVIYMNCEDLYERSFPNRDQAMDFLEELQEKAYLVIGNILETEPHT